MDPVMFLAFCVGKATFILGSSFPIEARYPWYTHSWFPTRITEVPESSGHDGVNGRPRSSCGCAEDLNRESQTKTLFYGK